MPFFFIFIFIFFATAAFLYHRLSFTRILFWHFWSAVFLLLHFFSFLPIAKMPDCFFTRSFQILLFWTRQWQDSINVPSLQIPHIQNHNREAKSLCYVSGHPLKWDEIPQVIPIKMGWSRLYSSMKFNLSGTGGSKGASKHSGWAYWGDGVTFLIQLLYFQDSAGITVPWCHPTAAPWAQELSVGPFNPLFSFVWCLHWILLCATHHAEKPVMSKQLSSCSPSGYFQRQTYLNIADNWNM